MNNNNNNNNTIDVQRQESLKRRWHDSFYTRLLTSPNTPPTLSSSSSSTMLMGRPPQILHQGRSKDIEHDRELVRNIVPSVTVVLEGRSICQRINLQSHANYQSLAMALRLLFKDTLNVEQHGEDDDDENGQVEISNAIPGHLVAYEDFENDLLLAGDLHWKDFVRVAKRLRILPAKSRLSNGRSTRQQ